MAAATVHTAVHDSTLSRVAINLSGFQAGTTGVQVTRKDLSTGKTSLVRGGRRILINTPSTDTVQLYDYEFPAGHQVEYSYFQLPDTTRWQLAAPDTYDVSACWLKQPLRPYLNRTIRVGSYDPFEHRLRGAAQSAVRRPVPIGGGDVRGGRRFVLTIKLDAAELAGMDDMLKVGGIWYWQTPGSDVGLPAACYVQGVSAKEKIRRNPQDGARWLELTLDEVAPPDVDLTAAAVSWTSILAAYATWNDLVAAYPTWNDLLAAVADPSEVTVS